MLVTDVEARLRMLDLGLSEAQRRQQKRTSDLRRISQVIDFLGQRVGGVGGDPTLTCGVNSIPQALTFNFQYAGDSGSVSYSVPLTIAAFGSFLAVDFDDYALGDATGTIVNPGNPAVFPFSSASPAYDATNDPYCVTDRSGGFGPPDFRGVPRVRHHSFSLTCSSGTFFLTHSFRSSFSGLVTNPAAPAPSQTRWMTMSVIRSPSAIASNSVTFDPTGGTVTIINGGNPAGTFQFYSILGPGCTSAAFVPMSDFLLYSGEQAISFTW